MEYEIKEIIESLENTIKDDRIPYEIESYECKQLLDYITNLQEENRQTKLLKERYQLEKEVYKSRNEKAIKYIEENCIDDEFYVNLTNKEKSIIEVLNILKESDKDE